MTQLELAVSPDQRTEHQKVPQQFIEECRVHNRRDSATGHAVEIVDLPGTIEAFIDLQPPWQRRVATVEFLVEVVAHSTDRLREDDARCDRVAERGQRYSAPAAADPRTDTAQRDRTPDSQAAFPQLEHSTETRTACAKVLGPVRDDMVKPSADQPERYRPQRDVIDDAGFASSRMPTPVTDDQRDNDPDDDAQRVGSDRNRPKVPDAL